MCVTNGTNLPTVDIGLLATLERQPTSPPGFLLSYASRSGDTSQ